MIAALVAAGAWLARVIPEDRHRRWALPGLYGAVLFSFLPDVTVFGDCC
jgi:hypothetical protein